MVLVVPVMAAAGFAGASHPPGPVVVSPPPHDSGSIPLRTEPQQRGTGSFGCRANIVHCNYSDHYSGSISWVRRLAVAADRTQSATESEVVEAATMEVTDGVGVCTGTYERRSTTWLSGKKLSASQQSAVFGNYGVLTIEFGSESGRPYYQVKASCPRLGGTDTYDDFITPENSYTKLLAGKPAKLSGDEMDTNRWPGLPEDETLASANLKIADPRTGSVTQEHPDADVTNKVVGSIQLKWSLKRLK
jgi:hypothetical protein